MEKIPFQVPDSDETAEFYVIEQTRVNGRDYILVTDQEDGDSDAFILKDCSSESDPEASYMMVESEEELESLMKIFASMLEDIDVTM